MVYRMADYETQGWTAMTTGGMEYYARAEAPATTRARVALPEYLQPDIAAGLFRVPVDFGKANATRVGAHDAVLEYELKATGPHSRAVLYYGPVDCITFIGNGRAEQEKGTPTMRAMVRPERTWQARTPEQAVTAGGNSFALSGLKAGTTYYYRLYVEHDEGKSWDYVSGCFKTHD